MEKAVKITISWHTQTWPWNRGVADFHCYHNSKAKFSYINMLHGLMREET